MQELAVQKYLRGGGKLHKLVEDLHLRIDEKDDLVLLNYDMIKSPKSNPIVQECRGLILRKGRTPTNDWGVVALPFKRFFNAGEGSAARIDWKSAWAEEKVDGSLITLFPNNGSWRIATRGVIDATGTLPRTAPNDDRSFADAVWMLLNRKFDGLIRNCFYVFEFTSPWNRNVTHYDGMSLYLLTVRDMSTLDEWSVEAADDLARRVGFLRPKRFRFYYLKEVMEAANKLPGEQEGFVVVDGAHRRIKVKNIGYQTLHRIYNNGQPDFWSLVINGDPAEVTAYFPEFREAFAECFWRLDSFLRDLDNHWNANRHITDRKTFALNVKDVKGNWILFRLFGNPGASVLGFWKDLEADVKVKTLKKLYEIC